MRRTIFALVLMGLAFPVYSSDFSLEKMNAGDIAVKAADVPAPAQCKADPQPPQDLVYKFQQVYNQLSAIRGGLTWVRSDLNRLETRAHQMIQYNTSDSFFESDLRKMSMDMSRRFEDMRRAAADAHNLLALAQKCAELNKTARDMDQAAREILNYTWPAIEDAAGNLEGTVRSGQPQVVGYNSQWVAMDISRYSRQLSDQARSAYSDTQKLVTLTRP